MRAYFHGDTKDEIVMEFDHSMKWDDALLVRFFQYGDKGQVASFAAGNAVTLKAKGPFSAKRLTYLVRKSWGRRTLFRGEDVIAALTFSNVPILSANPNR